MQQYVKVRQVAKLSDCINILHAQIFHSDIRAVYDKLLQNYFENMLSSIHGLTGKWVTVILGHAEPLIGG